MQVRKRKWLRPKTSKKIMRGGSESECQTHPPKERKTRAKVQSDPKPKKEIAKRSREKKEEGKGREHTRDTAREGNTCHDPLHTTCPCKHITHNEMSTRKQLDPCRHTAER
jgi:hypothetical protein